MYLLNCTSNIIVNINNRAPSFLSDAIFTGSFLCPGQFIFLGKINQSVAHICRNRLALEKHVTCYCSVRKSMWGEGGG